MAQMVGMEQSVQHGLRSYLRGLHDFDRFISKTKLRLYGATQSFQLIECIKVEKRERIH